MWQLVKFFIREDWKGRYAVAGVFIYIFTATLITYLGVGGMDTRTTSALFWLVVVFTTLQGITKGFIQMRPGHFLWWNQFAGPATFLGARLIASALLMLIYTLFSFLVFALMHNSEGLFSIHFIITLILTGTGISAAFTMSSAIATKTGQSGMLLPVLTMPLVLPVLLAGMKTGEKALTYSESVSFTSDYLLLIALTALPVYTGILLMKYLWKD